ncbi:MAG: leucine-rich repeat domain-containing protein [Bacteroidales bacterium]|nr:leucine-rich repeat domain-containing protein [Bacteroidales bacterium]
MKRIFTIFLTLFVASSVWAQVFEVNKLWYWINEEENNTATVIDSRGAVYSGNVTIPSSVTYNGNSYSVTSIGEDAFYNCSGLTSVTIPNSVTSIGSSAFSGCSGLTSITIPNGVTSIGIAAFFDCSGLTSITIPNSVTTIGEMAFDACNVLNSVTLPDNLDVSNVEIRVTKDGIRYQILNDKKVKVVFKYNESYTGDVVIPASISAGNTFTVTSIGDWAFNKCVNLTSVTIPNSVTSIGTSAFEECISLTSVTIPNSVTSIGERTFYSCSKLTTVTCLAPTPPEACSEAYSNTFENYNGYLYIPCVNKEDYENDACWGSFKHVECIGAETVELTKDEVSVVPEKTEAVFSMPKNESANSYTLTISNNGVTFCSLTFNAQGQLANIDFSTNKSYELKSGVEAFQFTVTGLSTAEDYGYSFKALASNKSVLKEYSGSFTTKNEDGTGGSVQGGGEGSGQGGHGGSTAVSEVSNATAVTIVNGQILVNGEAPAFVVTVSGQKIPNANLKSGVYFVVAEGETVGVSVR